MSHSVYGSGFAGTHMHRKREWERKRERKRQTRAPETETQRDRERERAQENVYGCERDIERKMKIQKRREGD